MPHSKRPMSSTPSGADARRGRRGARRLALQALYQWLQAGGESEQLVAEFVAEHAAAGVDLEYFRVLVPECIGEAAALDALLAPALDRAPGEVDPIEHAILLIGAAELRNRPELAAPIIINEAVELAKAFGAEGGHRYVNGVLDKLAERLRASERAGRRVPARG